MKIKILISCAGDNFSYVPGQEPNVDAKIAKDLIAAGFAEEVKAGGNKPNGKGGESGGNDDNAG